MSEAKRVLVVEDLPSDAELAQREIKRALGVCEFMRVETRDDYLTALATFRPELIVSDFQLPEFDGLTALALAREHAPDVPFIIVTGSMNEDTAVECMRAGAWDYVIKEHVKRLGPAIQSALERQRVWTERRRAEDALAASETRYRRLFEAAKDGILILDARTGQIIDVNPFLVACTGYTREEFLGKRLWELGPFKDIAASRSSFAELLVKEHVRYDDLPLQARDGRVLDVEFVSNVYLVNEQKVIQCNIRDITERRRDVTARKRAEDALRESEAWHRILFERSRDALMTLAPPSWAFTSGNPATVALFGAGDETDFMARAPWQYSPERQPDGRTSAEALKQNFETALSLGSRFFEWRYKRLSGEEFPSTVLLTRVEIGGQPLLQATVRDETEKQRLQASVAQADRLASMGMLAAGVAHEINNPLSYVLFNVESLAQDVPKLAEVAKRCYEALENTLGSEAVADIIGDVGALLQPAAFDDAADRAKEALAGSRRIKEICRGLGTFSRVEQVERSVVDLRRTIGSAVSMAQNEIRYRARIVEDYGLVPSVLASEGKLSQVFLNLLINAAHAIEEGQVEANRIGVRTWTEDGSVLAEVTDTGKGIPKENLARIFEPFFTTKPVGVGSGLGLTICRNIVTEFGGELSVESEIGKGTRFVVRLPALPDAPEKRPERVASDRPPSFVARGRILVVDDEEEIRKMLRRMLGRDHDIVALSSGEEACALLGEDSAFDVVLCDLMMPRMSGVELHRWIAGRDPALAGRVVFLTGGAFTPMAAAYLETIENVRLEKPVDTLALRAVVRAQVLESKAGRSVPTTP